MPTSSVTGTSHAPKKRAAEKAPRPTSSSGRIRRLSERWRLGRAGASSFMPSSIFPLSFTAGSIQAVGGEDRLLCPTVGRTSIAGVPLPSLAQHTGRREKARE
eukprot:scaffold3641_cov32-Tisochrysis_lutea.AAC.1